MPFKSKAQQRYFEEHRKELEAKGVNVEEWAHSTNWELPEHVPQKKQKEKP
jgi:hypothetical protein